MTYYTYRVETDLPKTTKPNLIQLHNEIVNSGLSIVSEMMLSEGNLKISFEVPLDQEQLNTLTETMENHIPKIK